MAKNNSPNAGETDIPPSFIGLGSWRFDTRLLKIDHWLPSSLVRTWSWRSKESRHTFRFSHLPLEIMTEILKYVHWRDLLIMRQVCKRLNDVSRTREVWTNQYQSYLGEKRFRMAAEESLDMYSPMELESWVLQRRSADWEWQSKSHPVHERMISFDAELSYTLVPGGRWLLTTMDNGSVLYHDLEDPQMRSNLLVPPREDAKGQFLYRTAVDVDYMSPTSKFFMVTYPSEYGTRFENGSLDLMIWSVNLTGHGSSACMEAQFLHSFPATEPSTSVFSLSLSGNLLARLIYTSRFRSHIEIFDWRSCTMSVHRRTVIFPNDSDSKYPNYISLLPGSRLVFVSADNLFVYDIGTMTEDQPIAPVIPQISSEPRWALFDGYADNVFNHLQSIQDNDAVILILTCNQIVYHLVIPHNVEHPPHFAQSMEVPHECCLYSAGTHKALVKKQNWTLIKIGTTNQLHSNIITVHQLNISPDLQWLLRMVSIDPPLLIEDIGRIIIKDSRRIFILETSRFPKFL